MNTYAKMHGLQVWAHSYCRSTLAFYEALAKHLNAPLRICLCKAGLGVRVAAGFTEDEFAHLDIVDVSTGRDAALRALRERADWHQIFGVYQSMPHIQVVLREAIRRGCQVGIASEAPCNMTPPSFRRNAKSVYLRHVAGARFSSVTSGARFIVNWSGDDATSLQAIGWEAGKIIPCGYFPPPLVGSKFVARSESNLDLFHVLCTGAMTWHRGPDVLMQALALLKSWGIIVRATFTGDGPLAPELKRSAAEQGLQCEFPGSVPMPDLIDLYETCSLFVAPGRVEPWGMRVNDALNCGAPSIVSRGMGACKLVFDYGFGSTFAATDYVDLAWQIRRFVVEPTPYLAACENLSRRQSEILPQAAARRVVRVIERDFAGWFDAVKQWQFRRRFPTDGAPHAAC